MPPNYRVRICIFHKLRRRKATLGVVTVVGEERKRRDMKKSVLADGAWSRFGEVMWMNVTCLQSTCKYGNYLKEQYSSSVVWISSRSSPKLDDFIKNTFIQHPCSIPWLWFSPSRQLPEKKSYSMFVSIPFHFPHMFTCNFTRKTIYLPWDSYWLNSLLSLVALIDLALSINKKVMVKNGFVFYDVSDMLTITCL
jgi:hypothetical protein